MLRKYPKDIKRKIKKRKQINNASDLENINRSTNICMCARKQRETGKV